MPPLVLDDNLYRLTPNSLELPFLAFPARVKPRVFSGEAPGKFTLPRGSPPRPRLENRQGAE
jgi:hypothetical protein